MDTKDNKDKQRNISRDTGKDDEERVGRRGFLKKMGFGMAAAAGAGLGFERLWAAASGPPGGPVSPGRGSADNSESAHIPASSANSNLDTNTKPNSNPNPNSDPSPNTALPRRRLGKTGLEVGLFSLGGEATVQVRARRDAAEKIINRALDLGVNYIDTSPTYGGGGSESNIGEVMAYRRDDVILATKTHERTYDGTMRLFEESLGRLQTDYLDLYQIHNVRTASDLDRALGRNGAVRALEELKQQGAIKFAGITGHKDPQLLLRGIREYEFDTILMSLNAADIHYRPFQYELLETAAEKEMGIIAMKVTAVGRIFQENGVSSMDQALGYVLTLPVHTAIVGISTEREVEENVRLAREFVPLADAEMRRLAELTASYQREGNFFKYHW